MLRLASAIFDDEQDRVGANVGSKQARWIDDEIRLRSIIVTEPQRRLRCKFQIERAAPGPKQSASPDGESARG
jgi:hypothetical protein